MFAEDLLPPSCLEKHSTMNKTQLVNFPCQSLLIYTDCLSACSSVAEIRKVSSFVDHERFENDSPFRSLSQPVNGRPMDLEGWSMMQTEVMLVCSYYPMYVCCSNFMKFYVLLWSYVVLAVSYSMIVSCHCSHFYLCKFTLLYWCALWLLYKSACCRIVWSLFLIYVGAVKFTFNLISSFLSQYLEIFLLQLSLYFFFFFLR